MKILVPECSGNKHGSSNLLASSFVRGAKENGHEITEFDVLRADTYEQGAESVVVVDVMKPAGLLLQLACTAKDGHRSFLQLYDRADLYA